MPNMSYCRFQNTLSALDDCYDALYNELNADLDNLSDEEKRAAKELINLCHDVAGDFESFTAAEM